MGFLGMLFGGDGKKSGSSAKHHVSKAEKMKAWGAKVEPSKGNYVPKHKR